MTQAIAAAHAPRVDADETATMLRLALDASGQGAWRCEVGPAAGRLSWDARCRVLFGAAADAAVDYATWAAAVLDEDRPMVDAAVERALDPAEPQDQYTLDYRVRHPDGTVLLLAETGRAMFVADALAPSGRRATHILGTVRDITAVQEQHRAAALLRTVLETAPGMIYAKDRDSRMLAANPAVMALIGKPWDEVKGRTDLEFLDDAVQAAAVLANDRRVMAAGQTEVLEEQVGGGGSEPRVWFSTKTPMRDAAGTVIGLVGVSVEITERKQAEDRLRLMMDELNHRVKNTLATVQAIAAHTLRGADPSIRATLESRLLALARAHDVLTSERWEGAALDDVVAGALAPHGGTEVGRFRIDGPKLRLTPRAALALAMGLHELATNALKHGALSRPDGSVTLHWEIAGAAGTEAFRMQWSERGGPPVAPPSRRGFGTGLVERSLAQDLGGTVQIRFDRPGGLVCTIDAPLAAIGAQAEAAAFPRVGRTSRGVW